MYYKVVLKGKLYDMAFKIYYVCFKRKKITVFLIANKLNS